MKNKTLNVKDSEAYRLAEAITAVTGESLTSAVKVSLRERYERLKKRRNKATLEDLMAISKRAAAHFKKPYLDHADLLYDENGLPK